MASDDAPDAELVVEEDRSRTVKASETSAAVTVIPLDGSLPVSAEVADALETAAGIRIQRLGGMGSLSTVSIRGSTSRQVAVFLDGIPLNPDGAQAINLSELPTTALDRIEVFRSNPPPEFGQAPMGGVVNLITPENPDSFGLSATVGDYSTHRLGANGGASVDVHGVTVDTWLAAETLGTEGDFEYFHNKSTLYNVWDDSFETRQNNDKSQINLLGRVRAHQGPWQASFTAGMLRRSEGIPGPGAAQSLGARLKTDRSLMAIGADYGASWGRAHLSAWHIGTHELFDDRAGEVGTGTQWQDQDTTMDGLRAHGEAIAGHGIIPSLTLGIRRDRHARFDRLVDKADDPMRRLSWSVVPGVRSLLWDDQFQLDATVTLQGIHNSAMGGVPFEELPGTASPDGDTLFAASPRGGFVWSITPTTVFKGSIGQYLRPPDFTELFGDRGGIIGNGELRPERGFNSDIGLRQTIDGPVELVADLAGFRSESADKIVFVQNSQKTMRPINLSKGIVQGVEAALTVDAFDCFNSRTSFTYSASENLSTATAYTGKQLPGIPEWDVWQQTSVRWRDIAAVGHSLSFTDGEYWDRTNWYRAAPRTMHAIFARVTPIENGPEIEFEVRNLTNSMVELVPRDPLNPKNTAVVVQGLDDFHGYPLAGRTVLFSVRWSS
jgi:iron complex outermembrane receptor protein